MISTTEIEAEIVDVEAKIAILIGNIDTNANQQVTRRTKLELGRRVLKSLNNTKSVIDDVNSHLGSI